ncbi:TPA: hypothetical protein I7117_22715 [Vibrio vulnificus]|nr:hypothetical protein [Vibrio vulnificus]
MTTSMTIALCNLELSLMVEVAKQRYSPVNNENATFELNAIDVGLDLGSRKIALSVTMREALDNIKLLNPSVYDAFVYAYNGSLEAN